MPAWLWEELATSDVCAATNPGKSLWVKRPVPQVIARHSKNLWESLPILGVRVKNGLSSREQEDILRLSKLVSQRQFEPEHTGLEDRERR